MTLVGVIIPAYNADKYLAEAIESCLAQTYPDFEIIVVDDGSTDNTAQVAAQYPQVRYFSQANQGVSNARNHGIRESRGDFLQFLDADDILLPTKIARCMAVFEAHPKTGLVYTEQEYRTADLKSSLPDPYPLSERPEGLVLGKLVNSIKPYFPLHGAVVRRHLVEEVGGFDESLESTEDWHLWIKLAAHGVIFRYVAEPLVWYRQLPNSLSKKPGTLIRNRLRAYELLRSIPAVVAAVDLDQKLAWHNHKMGLILWRDGNAAEARSYFRRAVALEKRGQWARRLHILLTYVVSADVGAKIMSRLTKYRRAPDL